MIDSPVKQEWLKANEESLINQSRSFSIPILNLDERFRTPIMVEYNLNKTIDTIEDSTDLQADEKIQLINTFQHCLEQGKFSTELQERMLGKPLFSKITRPP